MTTAAAAAAVGGGQYQPRVCVCVCVVAMVCQCMPATHTYDTDLPHNVALHHHAISMARRCITVLHNHNVYSNNVHYHLQSTSITTSRVFGIGHLRQAVYFTPAHRTPNQSDVYNVNQSLFQAEAHRTTNDKENANTGNRTEQTHRRIQVKKSKIK